jgi:hypothetical protein
MGLVSDPPYGLFELESLSMLAAIRFGCVGADWLMPGTVRDLMTAMSVSCLLTVVVTQMPQVKPNPHKADSIAKASTASAFHTVAKLTARLPCSTGGRMGLSGMALNVWDF